MRPCICFGVERWCNVIWLEGCNAMLSEQMKGWNFGMGQFDYFSLGETK